MQPSAEQTKTLVAPGRNLSILKTGAKSRRQALEPIMRKLLSLLIATSFVTALPAYADRAYGHRGYEHHGYHGGGSGWAGLAIFGALAGMAIMSEQSRPVYVDPYYVGPVYQQPPVYVEQPPATAAPESPPASTWYYCGSSAMYYPYTKACPEGWQAVPARPY